jgi:hypothetical protein
MESSHYRHRSFLIDKATCSAKTQATSLFAPSLLFLQELHARRTANNPHLHPDHSLCDPAISCKITLDIHVWPARSAHSPLIKITCCSFHLLYA